MLGTALSNSEDLAPTVGSLLTSQDPATISSAGANVLEAIAAFRESLIDIDRRSGPLVIVDVDGRIKAFVEADGALATELSGAAVVDQVFSTLEPAQAVAPIGGEALAVAAAPIRVDDRFLGAVVVTSRLDASYLATRAAPIEAEQAGVGLALADRESVLAQTGPGSADADVVALATAAMNDERQLSRTIGDRFYVARAVEGNAISPTMALVLSTPTS